jgi:pyridoxal phosphate enzyme (YggS family)
VGTVAPMESIRDNVRAVQERVARALERCGRGGERVTIVAVTKTFGADVVEAVIRAGIADIGENRVQEFLAKRDAVGLPCRWHLVGPLQRNKATKAVGAFHTIQSVDSVRIAQALGRLGGERGLTTRAFLEVNTSGEQSKHGVGVDEAAGVAAEIAGLAHLSLEGLMTVGPVTMDPVDTRHAFKTLYELRERVRAATGLPIPELSMGMSGDFEMALEEGATVVRLGRVITGERSP